MGVDLKVQRYRRTEEGTLREAEDSEVQRPGLARRMDGWPESGSPQLDLDDATIDLRGVLPMVKQLPVVKQPPDAVQPPEDGRRDRNGRRYKIGRKWSWTQVIGALLIAGVCVAAVVWYVPRVINNDSRMLTGTVTSSGVVTLDFQNSGVISVVKVQPNQSVHKGQVLAVEYAPNVGALLTADDAAISAVKAKITELKGEEALNPVVVPEDNAEISSEDAQIAMDQAQLATDRMRMAATEIVAPAAGVIVAANGQSGEAVTASGIRDYTSSAQQVGGEQQPQFSLLPEGPQSISHSSANDSSLPVIALRVSSSWEVVALIPEGMVHSIKAGQAVTISVPAEELKNVRGQIQEVLPTPAASATGPVYQATISITGNVPNPPLDGMAASIELSR
jgi:multidrug resistance efflux pump